jgi:hypothetical protein
MKSKKAFVLGLVVLLAAAASAITLADLNGEGPGGNQNLEIIRDVPDDSECLCPAIWDPVACYAPDGTAAKFSNACVAGCNGFTRCRGLAIQPAG